jgi:molybdenum cofactor guanylyltransferase
MDDKPYNVSGILLAGGRSSRMGEDKAFLKLRDKYLYEFSLDVLKCFSDDILISSPDPRYDPANCRRYSDEVTGTGPIGGLYTCLKKIIHPSAMVLPCDLPNIKSLILETLLLNSEGHEITVALNPQGFAEPLVGIYSASLVPLLENLISNGKFKMQNIFSAADTCYVKFPDVSPSVFSNINLPGDFQILRA